MKMKDFNINMTQYNSGDIITGTIVMIGEKEVVVAIGGLKEGVFPKEELDAAFKIGDAILVMVSGKIDDKGCLIVSHADVNKAIQEKEKLKQLKVGSELTFKVNDVTGAGLNGNYMGYRVFLPYSQCQLSDYVNKNNLKDREITAVVIELNNIKKSIVCSTKLLANQADIAVEIGELVKGSIIKLEDKYAIVLLNNGAKAKLSISDASYSRINSLKDVVELDKEYEFKVLDTNIDFTRISVGLKQTQENPTQKLYDSLNIGDVVEGVVEKIMPIGALIRLDNGLTAMAITKENTDRANVATHYIYKLHSRVKGEISYLNREKHKINIITNKKKEVD